MQFWLEQKGRFSFVLCFAQMSEEKGVILIAKIAQKCHLVACSFAFGVT